MLGALIAVAVSQVAILDEGVQVGQARRINCVGDGVSCSVSGGTGRISVSGGGEGSGAPIEAQYWTGAAHADLSAEKNLGALGTGLVINTAGVPSAYAGASCTNQFPRSLSASGVATCASVNLSSDVTGSLPAAAVSGAVATATALAANPADCSAGQYATTIAASGALTCAQVAFSDLSGSATDSQVANNITVDLAAAATALASNPTDCGANQYATTIAANGNLTCAQVTGSQVSGAVATATALAANPTDCGAGQYANAIDASGNLTCATPAGGGGGPTKLANDVAVAVSASYVTVFTVTGATIGNSKNAELFFRVVHEATANTIGMQYRVRSDDAYVGRCHYIAHGIAGTAASATGHEADTIAIAAAPADNAAAASCAAAAPCLTEVMCVLRSDASAGDVLLEAQLETGTSSAPIKAGSTYYTLVTN